MAGKKLVPTVEQAKGADNGRAPGRIWMAHQMLDEKELGVIKDYCRGQCSGPIGWDMYFVHCGSAPELAFEGLGRMYRQLSGNFAKPVQLVYGQGSGCVGYLEAGIGGFEFREYMAFATGEQKKKVATGLDLVVRALRRSGIAHGGIREESIRIRKEVPVLLDNGMLKVGADEDALLADAKSLRSMQLEHFPKMRSTFTISGDEIIYH